MLSSGGGGFTGLETILAECPHFKDWLARLERAAVVSR